MEQKLDIKQALNVFQKVMDHGQRVDDEYRLNGLFASTDFDGYTVFLRDDAVTLTLFFHNKYTFDFKRAADLDTFMQRLRDVERMQIDKKA